MGGSCDRTCSSPDCLVLQDGNAGNDDLLLLAAALALRSACFPSDMMMEMVLSNEFRDNHWCKRKQGINIDLVVFKHD